MKQKTVTENFCVCARLVEDDEQRVRQKLCELKLVSLLVERDLKILLQRLRALRMKKKSPFLQASQIY